MKKCVKFKIRLYDCLRNYKFHFCIYDKNCLICEGDYSSLDYICVELEVNKSYKVCVNSFSRTFIISSKIDIYYFDLCFSNSRTIIFNVIDRNYINNRNLKGELNLWQRIIT